MRKHCEQCGRPMQRWGRTSAGHLRFFCPDCKKTTTWKRDDTEQRHVFHELETWLGGKESLTEIADRLHKTRQTLWREFHPFFEMNPEPKAPRETKPQFLILDGTYIHSHSLCTLVSIDENDNLFWRFAPYESYASWIAFLAAFQQPGIVIMDGQKGLFAAARTLWPRVSVQRCQFHVVSFVLEYIGRRPKDEAGKSLFNILHLLKHVKTHADKSGWKFLYTMWEKQYEELLLTRNEAGKFRYPRLRSARLIMRRALPFLFTFLDHPGSPNTVNLVEGWVNTAISNALRFHRGLRKHEKKLLASVILSHLSRGKGNRA